MPGVLVIDSTQVSLLSDSAQVAAGHLRFRSRAAAPSIVAGNVLVGAQGGGFLVRVDSVRTGADREFTAYSRPARLTEAVKDGAFRTTISVGTGAGTARGLAAERAGQSGLRSAVQWGPVRAARLAPGASVADGQLSLNGVSLAGDGLTSVRVTSGYVDFTPEVDVGAKIEGFALSEFHAVATGTLEWEVNLEARSENATTVKGKRELAAFKRPFGALVGGVPVVGELELAIEGEVEVESESKLRVTGGVHGRHAPSFGGRYAAGLWSPVWEPTSSFTPIPVTASRTRRGNVRVVIRPVVRVILYRVVGPSFGLDPYVEVARRENLTEGKWQTDAKAGLDLSMDFDVRLSEPPFALELALFDGRLPGPSHQVYAGSGDLPLDSVRITTREPHVRRDHPVGLSITRYFESDRVTFGPPASWVSRTPSTISVDADGKVQARAASGSAYVVVQVAAVSTEPSELLLDSVLVRIDPEPTFYTDLGAFHGAVNVMATLPFDGIQNGTPSSIPYGGPPGIPFYSQARYGLLTIDAPSGNSNKPGFSTISAWRVHQPSYDFYQSGAAFGDALVPSLGSHQNDDGILFVFADSPPDGITAAGAHFGSIQEVSPCCVRQWVIVTFRDGGSLEVDLNSIRGGERAANAFFGITSPGRPISSIEFNQLGHNALLDNFTYGTARE